MAIKRNDATGWKRGAQAYSKSYPKLNTPPEYKLYATAGNTDHHQGKEIRKRVEPVSTRNYGLSAAVSAGNRPKHVSGKKTGSGIDAPDSVQFKKHRDYR